MSSHDIKPKTKFWFLFLMVGGKSTNKISSKSNKSTDERFDVWDILINDFIVFEVVRKLLKDQVIFEEC